MKKAELPGRQLRIYIDACDQWHGRPLYAEIVQEARRQGLAGATVARGIMGYGVHSTIHEPHLFQITNHLPVVIEIIDTGEKVQAFIPSLAIMLPEGLITLADVDATFYSKE